MAGHIRAGKSSKVVKMKRRQPVAAGLLLAVLSIYLLVLFIRFLTADHISIYEVTKKQIADDEVIRGIILRDETLITSDESGYINYYVGEGARVGVNTTVYSLDETGSFADDISELGDEKISLSEEDTREIRSDIENYRDSFSLSNYGNASNFKYDIDNTLLRMTTSNLLKKLDKTMKKKDSSSLKLVKSGRSGIISFCSDGLEDLSIDSITAKNFENMTDSWSQLRSTEEVFAGSVVYKLVNSEKWSIALPLTKEQYQKIYDKETIPVTFKKDGLETDAEISTFIVDSSYYARLDFDKYMLRYLNNRYIDLEIEFNNADGLKIQVSSILKKKCYVVPDEYITNGADSNAGEKGVMLLTYKKDGTRETVFKPTEIYYENEDGDAYVDAGLFETGATIVCGGGKHKEKQMQLAKTDKLDGVYCCNRGYCEFKRIEKLYENDEYAIVADGTTYGLSIYDHIILNPDLINENDVIY